jgi:hypothetical protein
MMEWNKTTEWLAGGKIEGAAADRYYCSTAPLSLIEPPTSFYLP